jgi:hypothetical protein
VNELYYKLGRQCALKLADANDDFFNNIVSRTGGPMPPPATKPATPAPKPVAEFTPPPVSSAETPRGSNSQLGSASERQTLRREAGF